MATKKQIASMSTDGEQERIDDPATPPRWVPILYHLDVHQRHMGNKTFYQDTPFKGVGLGLLDGTIERGYREKNAAIEVKSEIMTDDLESEQSQSLSAWWNQPKLGPDRDIGVDIFYKQTIYIDSRRLSSVLESIIDYDSERVSDLNEHTADSRGYYQTFLLYYSDLYTLYDLYASERQARLLVAPLDMSKLVTPRMNAYWDEFGKTLTTDRLHDSALLETVSLLLLIGPHYSDRMTPIVHKLQGERPKIEFENLWLLYKPGTLVYRINGEEVNALVVVSATRVEDTIYNARREERNRIRYEVEAWRYEWDGVRVVRRSTVAAILRYSGDRFCQSLPLVPAMLLGKAHSAKVKDKLHDRGMRYMKLISEHCAHRIYDNSDSRYQGQIIIDPVEFQLRNQLSEPQFDSRDHGDDFPRYKDSNMIDGPEDDDFYIAKVMGIPFRAPNDTGGFRRFEEHAEIDLQNEDQKTWLLQIGAFLLPSRIGGLALGTKRWKRFLVDSISEEAPGGLSNHLRDTLVLADDDKELLASVIRRRARSRSVQADFLPGKGEGQVFFLYGPSGTGKTLTAECVAHDTGRPLISLLKHDLLEAKNDIYGRIAGEESVLRVWFTLAARWGAILLIDEADILLERRTLGGWQNDLVTGKSSCFDLKFSVY